MHDQQKVARQIAAYIRERAQKEGVPMDLDAKFFERHIRDGVTNIFGVEWQGDLLVRDCQEPEPGFFRAWLARQRTRH